MDKRVDNRLDNSGHVIEQISAYLDGALDDAVSDDVRAHIDSCVVCHTEYVEVRATRSLLKSVPAIVPPRAFTLTPEMVGRKVWLWQRLLVPRNVPRLATGSALVFAMVALLLVGNLMNIASPLNFAPQAQTAASKEGDGFLPREVELRASDTAATPGETLGFDVSSGAVAVTPEAHLTPVRMPTGMAEAVRPAMPAATPVNLDSATEPAQGSTQPVPPSSEGYDTPRVEQGTSEPVVSATPHQYNLIISQPTADGFASNQVAQPTPDGGQVLFVSITGLLLTIGAAFAVGAVFAARR